MALERRSGETLTFAKFEGTCTECTKEIKVDSAIWSNKHKKTARHKNCPIEGEKKEGTNERS